MAERDPEGIEVLALVLGAASTLVEGLQAGLLARGFDDVRPAHGFVFTRLAPDGASVNDLAAHLGVTKQAASELVAELERKGYVERRPDERDRRAKRVVLTAKGWACTKAATASAADVVAPWAERLGAQRTRELAASLLELGPPGRLRPVW